MEESRYTVKRYDEALLRYFDGNEFYSVGDGAAKGDCKPFVEAKREAISRPAEIDFVTAAVYV